jgi:hypothetical protein
MARRLLLMCGIVSSALYVAMNVFIPLWWASYSAVSQTVSELSAIGAPTRPIWVPFGIAYTVLMAAFGLGVVASAGENRALRIAGGAMVAQGIVGVAWPPMHMRETLAAGGATLTDTLHLVFTGVTVCLMLLAMGFGAVAFGARFKRYSLATMATLFVCGMLTAADAAKVQANLPTPWVGVWERTNIGVFLLWVVVLATRLLRAPVTTDGRRITRATGATGVFARPTQHTP